MTVADSLLVIIPLSGRSAFTLIPYSNRGLKQSLAEIVGDAEGGDAVGSFIERDINFGLVNLKPEITRKYASTIICRDVRTPLLDDAWIGEIVQVACAQELGYPTGGSPQRSEVSGSSRTEGDNTFYRPLLTMMVTAVGPVQFDEWEGDYEWSIKLQEV